MATKMRTRKGFQVEMRVITFAGDDTQPDNFVGVGGYTFHPEELSDGEKLSTTRERVHMIGDELINKANSRLISDGSPEPVGKGNAFTALQIHELADLVEEGTFGSKVTKHTLDDGQITLTFTLTPPDETN